LLSTARQRLDLAAHRLPSALRANAQKHERKLDDFSRRLQVRSPVARLAAMRERLDGMAKRLTAGRMRAFDGARTATTKERQKLAVLSDRTTRALQVLIARRQERLTTQDKLLQALGYRAVLARGFVLVTDGADQPLRSVAAAAPGAQVKLRFADGEAAARIEGGPAAGPKTAAKKPAASQGGLFD
jgi:exodeoxyribonuclease VII large subunit